MSAPTLLLQKIWKDLYGHYHSITQVLEIRTRVFILVKHVYFAHWATSLAQESVFLTFKSLHSLEFGKATSFATVVSLFFLDYLFI